jgi:ribosome-associated protein YbcJ (S4-like RNA binding protein)
MLFMIELMETITLNVALKLSGMAPTGGQAKVLIQSGQVKVNGIVEFVIELESEE